MKLQEVFPRRKVKDETLNGPRGYIQFRYNKLGEPINLWVFVDIKNRRNQHIVEKILNDSKFTLCEDGEYAFDLNFSDKYRAMQLIGLNVSRRG